jgi:hypothetical protein
MQIGIHGLGETIKRGMCKRIFFKSEEGRTAPDYCSGRGPH